MKIKDLKFEDIAYYMDNLQPFLKSKIKQYNEYVIVVKNPKRFALLWINILLLLFYCYIMLSINYSMNSSLSVNIIISILILLLAIYFNSKVLYKFNRVETEKRNPNENHLKEYFYGNNFDEIKKLCIENNVINNSGFWVFKYNNKNRKRDISVFIAKLDENGLFKNEINMREVHNTFSEYFKVNFDYPEMTKVILDVKNDVLQKNDIKIYEKFSFLDIVKNNE